MGKWNVLLDEEEGGRGGLFAHVGLQVALSVRERLAGLGTVGKSASGVKCRKGVDVSFHQHL